MEVLQGTSGEAAAVAPSVLRSIGEACNDPGHREKTLEYWTQRLKDAPALLDLPADRPRPAHRVTPVLAGSRAAEGNRRGRRKFEQAGRLHAVHGVAGGVPNAVSRYTGATDIVVGSKVSIRIAPVWKE